jgi:hypothetical protein
MTMDVPDSKLLDAVKKLVVAVRDFLNADDGNDDDRIEAMSEGVHDVLTEARKTPALHGWAVEATATEES